MCRTLRSHFELRFLEILMPSVAKPWPRNFGQAGQSSLGLSVQSVLECTCHPGPTLQEDNFCLVYVFLMMNPRGGVQ